MLEIIKILLGFGRTDYAVLIQNGAIIIDVRTRVEFEQGHLAGAINIPLQELEKNMHLIDKNTSVIICCASGVRSASAKRLLDSYGYSRVCDSGSWKSLKNELN